jgi:hypothetical protein
MRNPRTAALPESLRPVSDLANAFYRLLYLTMDDLYQPVSDKGPLVDQLYLVMSRLLGPTIRYLMEQPVGDGWMAGPSFEVYEFAPGTSAIDQVKMLAESLLADHPGLASLSPALERLS